MFPRLPIYSVALQISDGQLRRTFTPDDSGRKDPTVFNGLTRRLPDDDVIIAYSTMSDEDAIAVARKDRVNFIASTRHTMASIALIRRLDEKAAV